jgi:hypothetical protein
MIAAKRRAEIEAAFASLRSKLFRFQQGVEQVADQQNRHRSADEVFKIHVLRLSRIARMGRKTAAKVVNDFIVISDYSRSHARTYHAEKPKKAIMRRRKKRSSIF